MAVVLDRDAGFCSGDEDEDLDTDMHSPTDASEDSVDVKVKPISNLMGGCKSKRKCAEPRKFGDEVKRRLVDFRNGPESEASPFRPWSHQPPSGYIPRGYPLPSCDQDEPLSLVLRDQQRALHAESSVSMLERLAPSLSTVSHAKSRPRPQEVVRLPDSTGVAAPVKTEDLEGQYVGRVQEIEDASDRPPAFSVESLINSRPGTSSSTPSTTVGVDKRKSIAIQSQQRNYKNMTRERRIEANARERTRVHTISAAFDTLRRAVPAYSHNQKLSKLSVLRIACSYILTLSRVAGSDYSADSSEPSLADCVENVSRTIQLEGKLRKKKDD